MLSTWPLGQAKALDRPSGHLYYPLDSAKLALPGLAILLNATWQLAQWLNLLP